MCVPARQRANNCDGGCPPSCLLSAHGLHCRTGSPGSRPHHWGPTKSWENLRKCSPFHVKVSSEDQIVFTFFKAERSLRKENEWNFKLHFQWLDDTFTSRTCPGIEKGRKISTFSFYLSSSCVILKEATVLFCGDTPFLGF